MNKNQPLLKINDQLYKIQIAKSEGILNLIITNSVTHTAFESCLDDIEIKKISESAGYIRNMDQFYSFLNRGACNEPKFNLTGKINQQDNQLILSLEVKLDPVDDNETTIYVIKLNKIEMEPITRMEEMMLDFSEILANFPVNEEKLKNLVNEILSDAQTELIQLIKKNKEELTTSIEDNKNEIFETIDNQITPDYGLQIKRAENELTQVINTNIANAKNELVGMIKKIQEVLDRNNLK